MLNSARPTALPSSHLEHTTITPNSPSTVRPAGISMLSTWIQRATKKKAEPASHGLSRANPVAACQWGLELVSQPWVVHGIQ
jgi:hypothetical protein